MPGINRIKIDSPWHDWRTQMADDLAPTANFIYRRIFKLQDGDNIIHCNKEEAASRYDWQEGIDVLLYFIDNTKATLQEKFLDYTYDTITFEDKKTSGANGAWYYCTAQYYFTGYARKYKIDKIFEFQSGILIDLPALHREDHLNKLRWNFNENKKDGRRSTFRYLYFKDVPISCIIDIFPKKVIQSIIIPQPELF